MGSTYVTDVLPYKKDLPGTGLSLRTLAMAESYFKPPPAPQTKLPVYRTLSPLAGLRVSPLILGAMSIGDKWSQYGMGSMDKASSFKLLDAYFDQGGNFIDTANN